MSAPSNTELGVRRAAVDLLHGCVSTTLEPGGWVRPQRFAREQVKALGSCLAWHPGLYRQMAACTAGVCLEFETDSATVEVEAAVGPMPKGSAAVISDVMRHGAFPRPPFDGISAEVDGRFLGILQPDENDVVQISLDGPSNSGAPALVRLPGMGTGDVHRVTVWLPCLSPCAVRHVHGDGTYIAHVASRPLLLVLGDSISQGFVGGDPALLWPTRLARELDLDLLNQGVGGQVFQPGSLAGLSAVVAPARIVVELGANYRYEPCQPSRVEPQIKAFLNEVSSRWPEVPVSVITPLHHLEGVYPTHARSCFDQVPQMMAQETNRHQQMTLIDGRTLLDEQDLFRTLADASDHPGPEAQATMADRLLAQIAGRPKPEAPKEKPASKEGSTSKREKVPSAGAQMSLLPGFDVPEVQGPKPKTRKKKAARKQAAPVQCETLPLPW